MKSCDLPYTSLFILLLLLTTQANYVLAQDDATSDKDACAASVIGEYNMGLRVGSLFIILGTTSLGTYTPILLHRISPYDRGGIRDWILTIGKFFGTGVILATAFVHMLPNAFRNFSNRCLTGGWLSYGSFAGVFCMISSFALQLLEVASVSQFTKYHQRQLRKQERDAEMALPSVIEETTFSEKMSTADTVQAAATTTHCHEHHVGDGHDHAHGALLNGDDAYKHIGTYILELGIVMHSVLIGITLATVGDGEFITLIIALVFHQFFEGIALGTRLNEMPYKKWYTPVLLASVYIMMTPLGIAIGIGIHSSFNENALKTILSSAILNSLSAGILLYNAYVSLMSLEVSHNASFHQSSNMRKICCFSSMYVGAGLMSLIGKWA
ncbi:MAG: Zinc/iron permease [Benjaminiella poitrasii]|nr:MAG: Zinc/iron permease [Benjaminiella poitrasii]